MHTAIAARDMLVVRTACQMPHIVRNGLAECLGIEQGRIRVIAPDVGGGFGYKGILLAEEVFLGWLAMRCGHPVRWIEDRREQLTGNANCREHHYVITGHAAADGRLLGIECEAHVDTGAYSAYPFSAGLEPAQVGSILPGPYVFEGYHCRTWAMATNKPAILPYRGVARTGVCFALEVLLDAMARELRMDPVAFRLKNLVKPEQMPFDNITAKHFDSGDYPECLRRAAAALDRGPVRGRPAGRGGPDAGGDGAGDGGGAAGAEGPGTRDGSGGAEGAGEAGTEGPGTRDGDGRRGPGTETGTGADPAPASGRRREAAAPDGTSVRATPSSASRPRTAPRSTPRGACPWCPATSRPPPASPRTAGSSSGSGSTRTDRASRRPSPRSPARCSASTTGR